ncbi:hypothetical protein CXB51_024487 [Gossypium anomalum]|uniref:DUF7745 domain-containing protein n=1 Tax=Gossypium anomalum TaxID=47600 RepID=A0A8J5YFM8_9ROSI|nr:hypothetical protein CXB51_024487 [Gossypium anomalum]
MAETRVHVSSHVTFEIGTHGCVPTHVLICITLEIAPYARVPGRVLGHVSIHGSISRLESFVMRNEYLNKVEDNSSVCTWSEKTQLEKGDSVTEGYTSEFWDFSRINIKVDKHLFRAMAQFWNPTYSCFTFGEVDVVPTLEEYTTLLRCPRIQGNKAYVRPASLPIFVRKLVMITGMSEQWAVARVQQKGDSKCIPWAILKDLILTHPDVKRKVNVLALSIYGLVIFPKAIGHIDEAVTDLFDRIGKQNTPVLAILAEMFRSLKYMSESRKQQLHQGETILQKKGGWIFFKIFERRKFCGKHLGWLLMKSFIAAAVLIGFTRPKTFVSGGIAYPEKWVFRNENHPINVIHEKGTEQRNLEGIRPYEPGSSLNNWTAEELPFLTHEVVVGNIALEEGKIAKLELAEETKQDLVETIMGIQKCGPKTHTGGFAIARINMRF